MLGMILKLHILLLLLLWCPEEVDSACNSISAQDMDDAAQLSKQIYGSLKKGDTVLHTSGYVVDEVFDATLDGEGLKAVVARKHYPKTIIISYRGTNSGEQLKAQFESGVAEKWKTLSYPGNMKVMQYIWDALSKLDIFNEISFPHGTKFILTGHSLGGAMATLLAVQLYFHDNTFWSGDNSLITFGSPRVGNGQFANEHDRLIPPHRKLRVVYSRDAVPQIPPLVLGFQHVSTEIFITVKTNREWYSVKCLCGWWGCGRCPRVRWVPYDYNWKVCPLQHGFFTCSKQFGLKYLVSDHNMDLYTAAADKLTTDHGKMRQFYADQCAN